MAGIARSVEICQLGGGYSRRERRILGARTFLRPHEDGPSEQSYPTVIENIFVRSCHHCNVEGDEFKNPIYVYLRSTDGAVCTRSTVAELSSAVADDMAPEPLEQAPPPVAPARCDRGS